MADGLLILQYTNFLKLAFVKVLQTAFAHPVTPEEYRYAPEREGGERQISIYRAWPKRTVMYPLIMVEVEPGDVSITQLGQEIIKQEFDGVKLMANWYGGTVNIPVRLTVYAKTTTDREMLTDLLAIYVRYIFRDLFALNRIEYLDISIDSSEEDRQGVPIFIGTVDVRCQMEFEQKIDMTLYDDIQKVSLEGLKYGTDAGDLTPIDQ